MSNSIKERPLDPIFAELQSMGAKPNGPLWEFVRFIVQAGDKTLTVKGEIQSKANVTGRTEQLSATLQNVDSAGTITANGVDLSRAYLNKTVDNINDGASFVRTTPNEKTGAGRGFNALDSNNRLAGTFRNNPVNVAGTPTSTTGLSNDGSSTSITVAAQTFQFGDGTLSYNSGSFDPGSFGTWYAWIVDPTFSGGVPTISFASTPPNQTSANGIIPLGKITTANGVAKTGGGYTGGTTPGGGGGRGYIQ